MTCALSKSHPSWGEVDLGEDEPASHSTVVTAVPEHSHPGESASNGKAEVSVKMIVDHARTLKVALEARLRLNKPLPCSHPVVAWIFERSAWLLSKYSVNIDGRTPYGLLHGKEAKERIAEFGEKVLHYVPKQQRAT